jgi:hypothetical protein
MMLRASVAALGTEIDVRAITDRSVDPLLPGGTVLLDLVDASFGTGDLDAARDAVTVSLGEAALLEAAGVHGNFEMMNRIADGTGIPVGKGSRRRHADVIEALGLARFDHTG